MYLRQNSTTSGHSSPKMAFASSFPVHAHTRAQHRQQLGGQHVHKSPSYSNNPSKLSCKKRTFIQMSSSTANNEPSPLTRRLFLTSIIAPILILPFKSEGSTSAPVEIYENFKSRRYIDTGRPEPDSTPPAFVKNQPVFPIDDDLKAQDIQKGSGETVERGSLVVCRWIVILADGTTVDDSNLKTPTVFRPGAHQVPPGIEDGVIGVQVKGQRRISCSAERFLTTVDLGYDIGERSLVPNGSTLFADIFVDGINPFGTGR